jgi:hypothetical protein
MIWVVLAGCWTGSTPEPAPPSAVKVNTAMPDATIKAVRRCMEDGPQLLVLTFKNPNSELEFEIEVAYKPGLQAPLTVHDEHGANFSPCYSHGCTVATLTIDELVIGTRARGRYQFSAKAGLAGFDNFEARWVGTPWAIECPPDKV